LNGLNGVPEDVTVRVDIYGLSLRLECGEQYAFVIAEDCEYHYTALMEKYVILLPYLFIYETIQRHMREQIVFRK
jgi:hypothetical protein